MKTWVIQSTAEGLIKYQIDVKEKSHFDIRQFILLSLFLFLSIWLSSSMASKADNTEIKDKIVLLPTPPVTATYGYLQ